MYYSPLAVERLDVEWPADRRDPRILDFAVVEID
jgi:hypothetical protein